MNSQPKKPLLWSLLAPAASAILLTLIQQPFNLSFLAWIAYVPLTLVSIKKIKGLLLCSYIISLVYWLGNIYWMGYVTVLGWIAFCAYTALLWPLLIISIRYLYEKKFPLIIAVPILIVGFERLQGLFLGGFFWRHLSHSQYANISLVQIADIFGAAGISFLIAMVNGLVADLILDVKNKKISRFGNVIKAITTIILLAGTIFYGHWRIKQGQQTTTEGPVVGVVQSNVPQSIKDSNESEITREVFLRILKQSKDCAASGAELIIWPETIVPAIMDKGVWPFLYDANDNIFYHKKLGEHSRDGRYVMIGSPGGKIRYKKDSAVYLEKYNSIFLYTPSGDQSPLKYNKIHLVPFGEVVPFKYSVPLIYNFLMMFSPYDFDYNLTPGTEYTVFELPKNKNSAEKYRYGVMICYEGAVPYIARKFSLDAQNRKNVDWLVNISNDGWFVRHKNGKSYASTELAQHTISCVFRAVENRISVLRSVNTGISCLIDPSGRIKDGYLAGNLPEKAFERKVVEGWFSDKIPIDSRITVFSHFGQWLDWVCEIAVFVVLILLLKERFIRKKMYEGPKNA